MVINSISAGSIASSVWAQVTRTLSADPATDAGAATLVWAHATRAITAVGTAITDVTVTSATLAAGAVLDNRPAAGKHRLTTILGNNSLMLIGVYDGVTFTQYATNTADRFPAMQTSNAAQCTTTKNSDASGHAYWVTGWDWS